MNAMIGTEDLYGELTAHQRRRLYFLFLALDKAEPETAIGIAERMERFVTSKGALARQMVPDVDGQSVDEEELPDEPSSADELPALITSERNYTMPDRPFGPRTTNGSTHTTPPCNAAPATLVRKSALDAAQVSEFKKAIASGASNEELATRFGLTRRQAHGLRIGFARAKCGSLPAKRPADPPPSLNPVAEREQQENFLRQRPAQPPTMEDVVRFLRQIGDIVVRSGDRYQVNYSLSLTTQELVMRANRKRAANGKPLFDINGANGAGAEPLAASGCA